MARNRKNQSAAIRFGPVVKAFLLCLLIAGSGVGYVWQKEQINRLGEQIRQRKARLNELIEENENRKKLLANMRSPAFLEAKIKELNLGLVQPQPTQVWKLSEPPRESSKTPREVQYAGHDHRMAAVPPANELTSQ